jgi:hypothetical protein
LKAKKNYCVIATENTKRPKISEIREDGKLILRCKFINQNQETIKAVLKQDMHHNKNGASANHTILRDANAADDMHAVSEDDESIGSLLMFVSVSDVATTPKTLFPSLKFHTCHCNLARRAARGSDGGGGKLPMVLVMAVL